VIADDEPDLLEIFAAILGEAGFDVQPARNGREALAAVEQGGCDAVICDVVMPDLDGLALLRAMRQRDLDLPVVFVTGHASLEAASEALELGALQYLQKPVPEEALRRAAERAVRLSRIARLKRSVLEQSGAEDRLIGDRAGLDAHFDRALDSLWIAFQPIVRASDNRVFAREALVRSAAPVFQSPTALFAAAERLGRVADLGRSVRACIAELMGRQPLGIVFVNLHAQELADSRLYDPGEPLSARARDVVLEITERTRLDSVDDVVRRVRVLRGLGYRIAVDNLGAGYAGLSSFSLLEPEVVKLDMSLIRHCDREPIRRRLIGAMAGVGRDLGIHVVAEGIETEQERRVAIEEGCDLLQGFLFGRPEGANIPS
jgi:EAL domain-containing protein (putative c-di-GMP-specific phosphodiesterase class I)